MNVQFLVHWITKPLLPFNCKCLLIFNCKNILCSMSNFGFYYISTIITYINLSIVVLVCDHNKL